MIHDSRVSGCIALLRKCSKGRSRRRTNAARGLRLLDLRAQLFAELIAHEGLDLVVPLQLFPENRDDARLLKFAGGLAASSLFFGG